MEQEIIIEKNYFLFQKEGALIYQIHQILQTFSVLWVVQNGPTIVAPGLYEFSNGILASILC